MEEKIKKIQEDVKNYLDECKTNASVEEIRVKYLGKKGEIVEILKNLKNVEESKRKEYAMIANKLKSDIES